MTPFHHVLGNNLVANVTNFTVWFAITFWVYLETRSVFATGMIAGIYLVLTAGLGIWFGSLVEPPRQTPGDARLECGLLRLLYAVVWACRWPSPRLCSRTNMAGNSGRSCCW